MTDKTMQRVKAGAKMGAAVGAVIFLVGGIAAGLYFGSYGTVILLSTLTGGAVEPGVFVRVVIGAGAAIGILCAGALSVVIGSLIGSALAFIGESITFIARTYDDIRDARAREIVIRTHEQISQERESEIRSRLSFFDTYVDNIHSIAIVGTAAYEAQEHGSDIDIVAICTERGYDEVRHNVCDREITDALDRKNDQKIEYIVLSPSETENLFRLGSPFAFAIRYGIVLRDDGYLRALLKRRYHLLPRRAYYLAALYDTVFLQYYGSIKTLEQRAADRHCSDECCENREGCNGLSPASMLANVILRMLYVLLPARGLVPLTKDDAVVFAEQVYGQDRASVIRAAAAMVRHDASFLYYTDYKQFKGVATTLFREVLNLVGTTKDVVGILADAARLMRGDYGSIEDPSLRQCVR